MKAPSFSKDFYEFAPQMLQIVKNFFVFPIKTITLLLWGLSQRKWLKEDYFYEAVPGII